MSVWVVVPLIVLLGILGIVLVGCRGWEGGLTADTRVRILEPKPGSSVTGPVAIRWSSTFEPGERSGLWFVVYVDAAPIAPGRSALVAAYEPCNTVRECLERGAIDGPNVFLTAGHELEVGPLPAGAGTEHRFTIVLVDERGIRDGDVAWNASFRNTP